MKYKIGFCILTAIIFVFCLVPQMVFAAETEHDLNKNKNIIITEAECHGASGQYTWLKYKPKSDGYLSIRVSDLQGSYQNAKGYITLYNSSKTTALSAKSIFYNTANRSNSFWYDISFGLKKGQVYYIRVMGENGVKLSRTFTKIKRKCGETRAKASNLKRNKYRKGLLMAGSSNADWYKINLTKKQKLRLYYNTRTRGSFKLSVYAGTQLIASRNIRYTAKQRKIILYLVRSGKKSGLIPGVYYIKIERTDASSSGDYKLKWN